MYETSNDLAPDTRRSAIDMLNEHLADAIDVHLQAKQAHWNIKGPNFAGLHECSIVSPLRLASTPT
jgi:starvation-inducible DNA-binding protein